MIDQLFKLVQQNASDQIINNSAIPNEKNEAAIRDVAENISSGLQDQAGQGKLPEIMAMFKNGGGGSLMNNPVVAGIIAKAATSLSAKFGLSSQMAGQISAGLLPKVLGQFVNKTNDPNDNDFDLRDIMKNFGGASAGSMMDKMGVGGLGKMFGN